jgi:formylglycine-generating enzyme
MKPIFLVLAASFLLPALGPATAAEPKPDTTKQITNSIGMKLTLIPSGEFMMGSGESAEETAAFFKKNYGEELDLDRLKDEHPQHRVRITKPFYLGTYDVTRGQFRQFAKDAGYKTGPEEARGAWVWNPRSPKNNKWELQDNSSWRNAGFDQTDEHPVVYVSWNDAVAFCKWLSKKEGKTYRLPTEAEWEYACRAGTTTRFYSGNDPETLAKVGNVADKSYGAKSRGDKYTIKASDGYVFTAPVGRLKPNAFGLYDMHGNVLQWCADWYGKDYYGKSRADDPTGPDSGESLMISAGGLGRGSPRRVLRGSCSNCGTGSGRSACRNAEIPDYHREYTGFRVARSQ